MPPFAGIHCPECGGRGLRGCGAKWHDGRPDTECSPMCSCLGRGYYHDEDSVTRPCPNKPGGDE